MGKCILAGHPQGGGQIGYGTYTGNSYSTSEQEINLGITPKWVLVFSLGSTTYISSGNNKCACGGLAILGKGVQSGAGSSYPCAVEIASDGFTVRNLESNGIYSSNCNYSGQYYNYIYGT